MKILLFIITILSIQQLCLGQRNFEYKSSLTGLVSTSENLPMWATANKNGIFPDSRGGLIQAGFFSDFNPQKTIQVAYGVSGAGYLTQAKNKIMIDELYLSAKWKRIRLDLGMIHPQEEFNGVSAQNGDILLSGNTRAMPGYNLNSDYISIPFTQNILSLKFNLSDYTMIDNRYVDKTRLHHKSLYVKITPWHRVDLIGGMEHWAQWAGDSPIYGKQPHSFRDYVKVFCAQHGGEGASLSDSMNVLGNHIGREYFRINYRTDNFTISCYHDIPFEDGSGRRFQNFPDGTYGIYYGAKNKKQWISDVMYEFFYTKSQSGAHHDRPATDEEKANQDIHNHYYGRIILGGNDNYFNNSEYRSGWTYYGRTIGTPFLTPKAPDTDGITLGVFNNRVLAHYLGIQGYICKKLPYKVRLSYSLNYGSHSVPLENRPPQFSFGMETGIVRNTRLPFQIDLGIYGDYGKLYSNNTGVTLTISRNGMLK